MNCINNESERNKRNYPPLGKHNIGGDFIRRPPLNFKNRYPHEQRILANGARNYSINRGIINNSELKHKQMPGQYQSSSSDSTFSAGRHIYRERQYFHTPFSNDTLNFANTYPGEVNNVRINGNPKYNVGNQSFKGGKLIGTDGDNRSSSSYIHYKKNRAIGKASYSESTKNLAYSGVDKNTSNRARRRARSGGSVAPPKKGMIKPRVSCSPSCTISPNTYKPISK